MLNILKGENMVHSFLLIGQSNMAGRGFINEAIDINTDRIKILKNGRWQEFFRPVHSDRYWSGVCLAESFAEKYAQEHDVYVGLIPCADGGTSIEQWQVGGLIFDHAIAQAKLAQRTSTIAGILWHQGETDCFENEHEKYEERFRPIMQAFREQLDLFDVPFILGGIGDFIATNGTKYLNDVFLKISNDTPMTGFVSAKGLTHNPDNLHFDSKSLYEFGLRYYSEFKKHENKNKKFEKKPFDGFPQSKLELL